MTPVEYPSVILAVGGLAEWIGAIILSLAAALFITILLRRLADLLRIPRWKIHGNGADFSRRKSTLVWRAIHAAPLLLALAVWLIPLFQLFRLSVVPPRLAGKGGWVLEIYCDSGMLVGEPVLVEELRSAGYILKVKGVKDSDAKNLLPLTLYCPEGLGHQSRFPVSDPLLRKILARHIPNAEDRVIPLRNTQEFSNHRLLLISPGESITIEGACDQEFTSRVLPLLTHALDRSLVKVKYNFEESDSSGLTSCGIIRYRVASEKSRAELLATILSDTLGLSGIRVSSVPEPGLPGMSINLSWSKNARFLAFAWTVLDEMESFGSRKDASLERYFRIPDQCKAAEQWLRSGVPSGWLLRRATNFREDWLLRYLGSRAFLVDFEPPDGDAAMVAKQRGLHRRVAVCSETGGEWKIVRFEILDNLTMESAEMRPK